MGLPWAHDTRSELKRQPTALRALAERGLSSLSVLRSLTLARHSITPGSRPVVIQSLPATTTSEALQDKTSAPTSILRQNQGSRGREYELLPMNSRDRHDNANMKKSSPRINLPDVPPLEITLDRSRSRASRRTQDSGCSLDSCLGPQRKLADDGDLRSLAKSSAGSRLVLRSISNSREKVTTESPASTITLSHAQETNRSPTATLDIQTTSPATQLRQNSHFNFLSSTAPR